MSILVKFLSILKVHAGVDSHSIQVDATRSLRTVLEEIDHIYFNGSDLIFDPQTKTVSPALLIMVNGQDYRLFDNQLECILDGTEEITLLSSIHGG